MNKYNPLWVAKNQIKKVYKWLRRLTYVPPKAGMPAVDAPQFIQANLDAEVYASEASHEEVKDWWEKAHQSGHAFWLTGSLGPEVWQALEISALVSRGRRVLNIGVGLGHCTKALVERGCIVDALDISEAALEHVRPLVQAAWLPEQFAQMPENTYELAISNLVAQHMSNADLFAQIKAVLRALKPGGIFAIQFSFPLSGVLPQDNESPMKFKNGSVLRLVSGMAKMVEEAGGEVLLMKQIGRFPEYRSGWYVVQIIKPEAA